MLVASWSVPSSDFPLIIQKNVMWLCRKGRMGRAPGGAQRSDTFQGTVWEQLWQLKHRKRSTVSNVELKTWGNFKKAHKKNIKLLDRMIC